VLEAPPDSGVTDLGVPDWVVRYNTAEFTGFAEAIKNISASRK
jgi:hypothetical protein